MTSPTMISVSVVVAPAVWRMRPPRPTPMIATRLAATAPKTIARGTPGWLRATWRCLPVKIRWPSSKPTTSHSSAIGNTNAATVAALAASTSRRAGIALKVVRIMPVEYSAVTVRTASAPSRVAAMMTPNSDALVASKLLALLGGHAGLAEL